MENDHIVKITYHEVPTDDRDWHKMRPNYRMTEEVEWTLGNSYINRANLDNIVNSIMAMHNAEDGPPPAGSGTPAPE